jgi:hypothetical protein
MALGDQRVGFVLVANEPKGNGAGGCAGHVFWTQAEAEAWTSQEYVRDRYSLREARFRLVRCACSNHECWQEIEAPP